MGKPVASAQDHYDLACAARFAARLDDPAGADALYQQAAQLCSSVTDLLQLAARVRRDHVDEQMLKTIYRSAGATLSAPVDRLQWAQAITTLCADREWARQAYDELEASLTDDRQREACKASRQHRLEWRL